MAIVVVIIIVNRNNNNNNYHYNFDINKEGNKCYNNNNNCNKFTLCYSTFAVKEGRVSVWVNK
jgi:hypothetical protein